MAADWGAAAITPEWPVAPIPTEPVANHPGGEQLPLRWPHHGDLRILVDVDTLDVFLAAEDLLALAELDATDPAGLHPVVRPSTTWCKRPGERLLEHYTLADAVTVLERNPTHQTGELLAWLREQLPDVLRDEVLDHAIGLEGFLTAYTVQQAATILDRDPAIRIGRTRLFEVLEHSGWARRDEYAAHWRPTSAAIRHHWLTVRDVTVRSGKTTTPYPQLYVTPAGLAELRRILHALHPDAPATPAPAEQLQTF